MTTGVAGTSALSWNRSRSVSPVLENTRCEVGKVRSDALARPTHSAWVASFGMACSLALATIVSSVAGSMTWPASSDSVVSGAAASHSHPDTRAASSVSGSDGRSCSDASRCSINDCVGRWPCIQRNVIGRRRRAIQKSGDSWPARHPECRLQRSLCELRTGVARSMAGVERQRQCAWREAGEPAHEQVSIGRSLVIPALPAAENIAQPGLDAHARRYGADASTGASAASTMRCASARICCRWAASRKLSP